MRLSLPPSTFAWFSIRRSPVRLGLSLVSGAIAFACTYRFGTAFAVIASWDATSLVLLAAAWHVMGRATAEDTQERAGREDPGRTFVWILVLLTSTVSLFAAAVGLRMAKNLPPEQTALWVGLSLGAVVSSWLVTHTSWTLRYAHLYYRDSGLGAGGLTFPSEPTTGDEKPPMPDDFDFAYFAFTVGMCFQVSDVVITDKTIRRAVLMHAAQSFAYNTAIMALALNLGFGFLT